MVQKVFRNYLFFLVLFNLPFSLAHAVYVLFLIDSGMSMFQVGVINFMFMLGVFILEIPTGVIADFFGRKFSVILGVVTAGLGCFVYYFCKSFIGFVVAELTIALGHCFVSGALDAWVKDSMDFNGDKEKFGSVFSAGEITIRSSTLVGGFVGVLLAKYSYSLPWLISGIGIMLCSVFSVKLLKEDYFVKQKFSWQESLSGMKNIVSNSVKIGYHNKSIWTLIVLATLLTISVQPINMNWQIYFQEHLSLEMVGFVWIGIKLFELFGNIVAGWLLKTKSEEIVIRWSIIFTATFVLVMAIIPNAWIVLTLFWLHEIGRGMFNPASKTFLHDQIDSKNRATISSFQSMVTKFGAGVGWLASGLMSDVTEIQTTWLFGGLLLSIAYLFSRKIK